MAQVNVSIAGRLYRMACDDGEEHRLESLAARLDGKIAHLRAHFGEIGDQRLTVMAALTIADDLGQAEKRIVDLERMVGQSGDERIATDDLIATSLEDVARRVERAARHLDGLRSE